MAYLRPHIDLAWKWKINGTDEIGSSSLKLGRIGGTGSFESWLDEQATRIESYATMIGGFWSDGAILVPSACQLTSVKMALVETNGKQTTESVEIPVTYNGFYSSQNFAPQIAVVTSLRSDKFRPPAKDGRFYTPSIVGGNSGVYYMDLAGQTAYITKAQDFLKDINDVGAEASGDNDAQIILASPSGPGYEEVVTQLRVGRLYDTQRRRRNRLTENYLEAPMI